MRPKSSPLKSMAQHRMIERAATDEAYAKERGITQAAAKELLDSHRAAGSPALPERVRK